MPQIKFALGVFTALGSRLRKKNPRREIYFILHFEKKVEISSLFSKFPKNQKEVEISSLFEISSSLEFFSYSWTWLLFCTKPKIKD